MPEVSPEIRDTLGARWAAAQHPARRGMFGATDGRWTMSCAHGAGMFRKRARWSPPCRVYARARARTRTRTHTSRRTNTNTSVQTLCAASRVRTARRQDSNSDCTCCDDWVRVFACQKVR